MEPQSIRSLQRQARASNVPWKFIHFSNRTHWFGEPGVSPFPTSTSGESMQSNAALAIWNRLLRTPPSKRCWRWRGLCTSPIWSYSRSRYQNLIKRSTASDWSGIPSTRNSIRIRRRACWVGTETSKYSVSSAISKWTISSTTSSEKGPTQRSASLLSFLRYPAPLWSPWAVRPNSEQFLH